MIRRLVLMVALVALALPAAAAPIYGTAVSAANYTGSRTEGNPGIITLNAYVNDGKTQSVSWQIAQTAANVWSYKYTFTNFARPEISHLILELSPNCGSDPLCLTNLVAMQGNPPTPTSTTPQIGTYDSSNPSNPNMPAAIYGVKIDFGNAASPLVISFTSNRNPVWGNFYTKGGSNQNVNNQGVAYNSGLLAQNAQSENPMDFIARPNGGHVSEPTTVLLALSGLGMLFFRRRK